MNHRIMAWMRKPGTLAVWHKANGARVVCCILRIEDGMVIVNVPPRSVGTEYRVCPEHLYPRGQYHREERR